MMTTRPHRPLRVPVFLGLAAAIFVLFAAMLPAASASQHRVDEAVAFRGPAGPPPPPPDCATEAPGHQRNVSSVQQDALAGYEFTNVTTHYGYDEVAAYDGAHPEEIRQRSKVSNGIYSELFDPEGVEATTVISQFDMISEAFMHLEDGQPAPGIDSYAQMNFRQPVRVVGDGAFLNFNSALLETQLGQLFAYTGAYLHIKDENGALVHVSNIFNHDELATIPDTGLVLRNITVPLDEASVYEVSVLFGTGVRAFQPGPAQTSAFAHLYVEWGIGCSAPEPLSTTPQAARIQGEPARLGR